MAIKTEPDDLIEWKLIEVNFKWKKLPNLWFKIKSPSIQKHNDEIKIADTIPISSNPNERAYKLKIILSITPPTFRKAKNANFLKAWNIAKLSEVKVVMRRKKTNK